MGARKHSRASGWFGNPARATFGGRFGPENSPGGEMSNTPHYSELNTQMNLSRCEKIMRTQFEALGLEPKMIEDVFTDIRLRPKEIHAALNRKFIDCDPTSAIFGMFMGIAIAYGSADEEVSSFVLRGYE